MIGWETFFTLIEKDIKSEVNIIIATLHWYMIKNSFVCLGLGDNVSGLIFKEILQIKQFVFL